MFLLEQWLPSRGFVPVPCTGSVTSVGLEWDGGQVLPPRWEEPCSVENVSDMKQSASWAHGEPLFVTGMEQPEVCKKMIA